MADISLKRLRDDDEKNSGEEEDLKRFKFSSSSDPSSSSSSYNDIVSFFEEDEEEPNQDLSSLITSLQQEISSTSEPGSAKPVPEPDFSTEPNTSNPNPNDLTGLNSFESSPSVFEDEVRHLLEASDDELGIPNIVDEENGINGGGNFEFSLCDGLWELEDATANYYTLFQSELFM